MSLTVLRRRRSGDLLIVLLLIQLSLHQVLFFRSQHTGASPFENICQAFFLDEDQQHLGPFPLELLFGSGQKLNQRWLHGLYADMRNSSNLGKTYIFECGGTAVDNLDIDMTTV